MASIRMDAVSKMFDWTISLGSIGSAFVTVAAIIVASFKFGLQIKQMEFKLDMIWSWYKKEHGIGGHKAHEEKE